MRHFRWLLMNSVRPLYEGEGVGAGGAPAGTGTPAGGTPGAGEGWKAPDGLPAEFAGKDAGETFTKLWDGYQKLNTRTEGLRTQLAQLPKAPDNPDGYDYQPSDALKPFFAGDLKANPALKAARAAAHKHGIPAAAFNGLIEDTYGPLVAQGLLQAPYDEAAELKNFAAMHKLDAQGTAAALKEAETFAQGLAKQLKVPGEAEKDVTAALVALTDTAAGNTLLRALSGRLAENGFKVEGQGGAAGGPLSDAELDQLTADPRIDPRNQFATDPAKKYDLALRQRYDEGMARRGREKFAGKQ